MGFLDFLTTSAVSLVIGGNTGINPCLTLFLMGCIERYDPDLVNMEGTMEALLSSWPGLIVLGVASVLEFVGNCVPVLDQIIDSAMAFVVPIMSVLGSLSTFGLFDQLVASDSAADQGNRELEGAGSGVLIFFQIILVISGVVLALSLHLFKMFIRLLGEGCLTGLITAMEVTWTFCVVTLVIFIQPVAIVVAVFLCFAAVHAARKHYKKKKKERQEEEDGVIVEEDVVVVEEGYVKMGEQDKKDGRPVSPVTKEDGDVVVIEQGKGYKSMDASKV